jgi:hypothetical protein
MSISVNPAYRCCEKAKRYVSLEQTEGECRERHNCAEDACPLENEFGQNNFRRALEVLSTNIGMGWASAKDR